jgi:CRISPR system Cascade subunit CasE
MSARLTLSRARLAIGRGGGEAERRSTAPYLVHQAVADLFGDRDDRGYLYRITAERPGTAEVLVLSRVPPLASERVASPTHRRAERVESKPFAPALRPGQSLDFEIRLNATRVVTDRTTGSKHRTDVWEAVWRADRETPRTPHEVYGDYLRRKLEGAAELGSARVIERGEVRARRGDRREAIRFVAANLIGTLRVTDPASLLEVVATGIGREKAFGCGLLCLSAPGTVLARRYPHAAAGLH